MSVQRLRVINVLSPEVYNDAHIKGSMNVPLGELKDFAQHTDKDTPLVLYCASYTCNASVKSWHILHELGFEDVLVYEGGMNEWYHSGLPTEGECAADYLKDPITQAAEVDHAVRTIDVHDLKARMEREGLL